MKVGNIEPATSGQTDSGVQVKLQDRPVAIVEECVAGWQGDELPVTGCGKSLGLVPGAGGLAGDKLSVGRIANGDGKTKLGCCRGQVLVETRQRCGG